MLRASGTHAPVPPSTSGESLGLGHGAALGGFNACLDALERKAGDLVEFTLLQFDSVAIDKLYDGVPRAEVERLTRETYQPYTAARNLSRETGDLGAVMPFDHREVRILADRDDGIGSGRQSSSSIA